MSQLLEGGAAGQHDIDIDEGDRACVTAQGDMSKAEDATCKGQLP